MFEPEPFVFVAIEVVVAAVIVDFEAVGCFGFDGVEGDTVIEADVSD